MITSRPDGVRTFRARLPIRPPSQGRFKSRITTPRPAGSRTFSTDYGFTEITRS